MSRNGSPEPITTDLWTSLMKSLDSSRIRTTAYQPQCNNILSTVQQHTTHSPIAHHPQDQLRTADTTSWLDHLPLAMLNIRSTLWPDVGCSVAEMVCMIQAWPSQHSSHHSNGNYTTGRAVECSSCVPRGHDLRSIASIYVPKELEDCTHILARVDKIRPPLSSPYDDLFPATCHYVVKHKYCRKERPILYHTG